AADFAWRDGTVAERARDRAAARQHFPGGVTASPDMKTTSVSRVVGDDAVATEIEWSGTHTGPMVMGGNQIPPTNKSVTGRGTYFARFRDGKVVEFRSHPDVAGVMMQLGMMPPP